MLGYFSNIGIYEIFTIIMIIIVFIWVGFQVFSYKRDLKVIKIIRNNSEAYGDQILQLIDDSKVMETHRVNIKTITQLMNILKSFPQHKIIKRLQKRFRYAKEFAEKEQYVLSDVVLHFDYVTLPVISGILSLFALLDKRIEKYLRTNLKNKIDIEQADTKLFEVLADVIKMFKTKRVNEQ